MSHDDASLLHQIDFTFLSEQPEQIGVAVSGGSDSVALLHLMATWAKKSGVTLMAVTVDHGLRKESAEEAVFVADICEKLGVAHTTLKWEGWNKSGNLQDQARRARYSLMADWANNQGLETIVLGHTADDQAETFLMRLARGAGVDGLAGMAKTRSAFGMTWRRPLLEIERQDLREYLTIHDLSWVDDPSNEDERYDRIKARKILQALKPLGIDGHVLTGVATHLSSVKQALDYQTTLAARQMVTIVAGDVCFERTKFIAQPLEIQRRLLVHAIKWVASAEYGPRGRALQDVQSAVILKTDATLHGCRILSDETGFRITRELKAVQDIRNPVDELWDRRWRVLGPEIKGFDVAALGENGLQQCKNWRQTGLPRASLFASPAVWRGTELVAAPLAGMDNEWATELAKGEDHFFKSILSH